MPKLKVVLNKSVFGETPRNRATIKGLGLGKTWSEAYHDDNASIRGMIHHVKHLLTVTTVDEAPARKSRIPNHTAKAKAAAGGAVKATKKAAAPSEAKPAPAKKPAAKKTKETE